MYNWLNLLKWLNGLKILFRIRPVAAWGIGGILLGIGVAVNQVGWGLNWGLLVIGAVLVILIQAIMAHAINDLVDEDVDRTAEIEDTGRQKVLISGVWDRGDLKGIFLAAGLLVIIFMLFLISSLGLPIIVFVLIGLYAAICYNAEPLRLGWRPFSEITVVLPTLTTLVVAVAYVATGEFLWLALEIGIMHALVNICFFITSRAMDIDADKQHGKVTTLVLLDGTGIGAAYPATVCIIACVVPAALLVYTEHVFLVVSILTFFALFMISPYYDAVKNHDSIRISISRKHQMHCSIIHSILLTVVLIVGSAGVWILKII